MYTIEIYFLLYLLYSFSGWVMEVILNFISKRKFINRGFLIGPCCPIYGTGAIMMTLLLKRYLQDPVTLFIMATLICSILEYITSYAMEKIFKARWWDYSDFKFNINGRICLETTIPFGIGGFCIMYILNPFFIGMLEKIPSVWLHVLSGVLLIIFIIDNILSFKIITHFKNVTKSVSTDVKDNTEEITNKVKEILKKSKSKLDQRLLSAFPNFKTINLREKIESHFNRKKE